MPGLAFLGQRASTHSPAERASTPPRREARLPRSEAKPTLTVGERPQPNEATATEWLFPRSEGLAEFRSYQHVMARTALSENTLVSLPTGLGKTLIASVVLYNHWRWFPNSIVIFMAPTRPLIAQQLRACCSVVGLCPERDARLITGADTPATRCALWAGEADEDEAREAEAHQGGRRWRRRRAFFCTPQTLSNDLENGVVDGRRICCLIIDEAHHAASPNYGYALVLRRLRQRNSWFRVLGLSATAGADLPAVQRVVDTLGISRIETRDEQATAAYVPRLAARRHSTRRLLRLPFPTHRKLRLTPLGSRDTPATPTPRVRAAGRTRSCGGISTSAACASSTCPSRRATPRRARCAR